VPREGRGKSPRPGARALVARRQQARRLEVGEGIRIEVMRHPLAMFGSDGWVLTPRGPLAEGKPHPRCYGTYPRIFGHYVRETGVLTLEAAVHKAAYRPAEKLGLTSKGRVQVGADADLVVFDPATVRDLATYADPHRFPAGIEHVLVAGEMTVRDGRHTGARAGRVLRRP
jgi:N-acyl-D-amino-acid deacylase